MSFRTIYTHKACLFLILHPISLKCTVYVVLTWEKANCLMVLFYEDTCTMDGWMDGCTMHTYSPDFILVRWPFTNLLKLKMTRMALTYLCQDYFLRPTFLYLTFRFFSVRARALLQLPLQFKPHHLPN